MRLELHNIGPVKDACVELGPMTVLVGPNGSGKTILSSVAYAAANAGRLAHITARNLARRLAIDENPRATDDVVRRWEDVFRLRFESELKRCYGEDLTLLGREFRAGRFAAPRITIGQGPVDSDELWNIVFRLDVDRLVIERSNSKYRAPSILVAPDERMRLQQIDRRVRRALLAGMPNRSYYFPASRSGLMQTYSTLTALVFGALGGGYFEDVTLGKIPGTASDFLQFLAQLDPTRTTDAGDAAVEIFERDLLHGHIELDAVGPARRISFAPEGLNQAYPIESAATSAAEVAPLLLYLRHAAVSTDAVFIDEPEAHFHPKSQVSLAQALMAAAQDVENIVIATHSEFLVSELSNVVMAEAAENPQAVPSLRIYEFITSDARGGVTVKQHMFDPLEGFDIKQFSQVAEETYERSIEIYNRVHDSADES